ncbi:MAG: hypothetical protein AB7U82_28695 [Blastocatellales bacterium]
MAKLINIGLIYTEITRGEGVEGDPVRAVQQWFTPNGILALEYDGWKDQTTMIANMVDYLRQQNL